MWSALYTLIRQQGSLYVCTLSVVILDGSSGSLLALLVVHSLNLLFIADFMFDCPVTASARAHMYDIDHQTFCYGGSKLYVAYSSVWICVIDKTIHVSAGAIALSFEACE